jgi:hypothetical protein
LIVFFFLWQASVYYAQRFVAVVVGFVGVTIIRVLFLLSRRKLYFRSWYRERPGPANLLLLALEWAYFAFSLFFIVVRTIKLLLCAAFNVGRIDTPFLAVRYLLSVPWYCSKGLTTICFSLRSLAWDGSAAWNWTTITWSICKMYLPMKPIGTRTLSTGSGLAIARAAVGG